ncbi:hypothetical protein EYF80_043301 [Liparis tanakae]|uniref:Uncharacterized protein n=1 Tax=Liparis tanakae TaxID=230148 RepID=A0A4Z2G0R9_9TELE|nr:hypothetical protein EYF80_043301 [Liparis tanakae]
MAVGDPEAKEQSSKPPPASVRLLHRSVGGGNGLEYRGLSGRTLRRRRRPRGHRLEQDVCDGKDVPVLCRVLIADDEGVLAVAGIKVSPVEFTFHIKSPRGVANAATVFPFSIVSLRLTFRGTPLHFL